MEHTDACVRQQQLLTRSAELRMQLAQQAQVLQAPLVAADQARSLVHRLAERPIWPMLTALLLIAWRPVRTVRWAARLWWTWRGYQKLRFWLTRQC